MPKFYKQFFNIQDCDKKMTSISQAAVAASVLVGLVSIPAASSSVNMQGAFNEDLPSTSDTQQVPREVERATTEDGFFTEVETAFNRFSSHTTPDRANASLENPRADLKVSRTPSKTSWKLKTATGTLTIEKTSSTVREVTETSEGTLKKIERNGAVKTSFEGKDRTSVEQTYMGLRDMLEKKRNRLEKKTQEVVEKTRPDVEVTVNETTADDPEYALIRNMETEPVNLKGWKLTDEVTSYEFGDLTLEAGESLRAMSNDEWQGFEGTGIAWNNNGPETATLKDKNGREVDSSSY